MCSLSVAVLNHKVSTSTVTFCNTETFIQLCMIYESGVHCGIMLDISLCVEMQVAGLCMALINDSKCMLCVLNCSCFYLTLLHFGAHLH